MLTCEPQRKQSNIWSGHLGVSSQWGERSQHVSTIVSLSPENQHVIYGDALYCYHFLMLAMLTLMVCTFKIWPELWFLVQPQKSCMWSHTKSWGSHRIEPLKLPCLKKMYSLINLSEPDSTIVTLQIAQFCIWYPTAMGEGGTEMCMYSWRYKSRLSMHRESYPWAFFTIEWPYCLRWRRGWGYLGECEPAGLVSEHVFLL